MKHMAAKRIGFSVLFLLFSITASAQLYEYEEYTVKKGDTLWDISRKHIKDSYQWPMIWKENQRLNNPDKIYPGQKIRIPVRVLKQEEKSIVVAPAETPPAVENAPAAPAPTPPTVEAKAEEAPAEKPRPDLSRFMSREAMISTGYISPEIPKKGVVSGAPEGRTLFGGFDEIYIKTTAPAKKGDRFYVVRGETVVNHPDNRQRMGHLIHVLAVIEVMRVAEQTEARVTSSFESFQVGDPLDIYYEIEKPELTELRRPDIKSTVVASSNMRILSALYNVVYLDKGKADGLQVADTLMTLMPGSTDRQNAVIQIINVRDKTSTALVLKSQSGVAIGDRAVGIKE